MGRSIKSLQYFAMSSLVMLCICCTNIFFLVAIGEGTDQLKCIDRERKALLQFKNGLVDDYGILSSWNRSSQDCCLWQAGVGCSKRTHNVIKLDLHGYWSYDKDNSYVRVGLSGAIDSSLLQLHHLEHLDLSGNSFPRIPEFIGSLRRLRHLNLSKIAFGVSNVPAHLGNLSYLQTLDLSSYSLVLKNTEWLNKLALLEFLDLSFLDLSESTNTLVTAITRLPLLSVLKLRNCLLQNMSLSSLPSTNFSKSLSILDISENYVSSSSIYPWLFNFSETLIRIDISNNELLGSIPEAFGAFEILQDLHLDHSGLEGGIPRSFGNFSSLRVLDLHVNSLNEDLTSLFHLLAPAHKSIELLDLSYNNIVGSLPDFTMFIALTEIHLRYNQMQGSFPNKFERRSNLLILDLADNQITGVLPDLSELSSLRELYFERNHIEGTLGEKIMQLSELQFLGVSSNLLQGTITGGHFENLSRLVYLDLSYNSMVLELNSDWSPTFSLDVISLSSCNLGPSFPIWLRTQKNFSIMDISNAQINDSVPNWFWEQLPSNLRYFNLSSNQLHGSVPDLLFGEEASIIDLSSNYFSGRVPSFPSKTRLLFLSNNTFSEELPLFWNTSIILYLDLSDNLLSGEIPDFWMNITHIQILNLDNNKFHGRIPTSMGNLTYLIKLSMRNNSLTGVLPSSLENCILLALLDVGQNKLSGQIPAWIGKNLSSLHVLSLESNGFHGTMPTSICSLANIQILDISCNNISGTIPRCIGNLNRMTEIKSSSSFFVFSGALMDRTRLQRRAWYVYKEMLQWKGRKYVYQNTLGLVTSLDLSSNNFNGNIPAEITNLTGLLALNLSRNNLTLQIPQDIGRLRWMDFLDLSRNHLVGGIPTSLQQLTNLGMLDLSNNNLSGRIPSNTQLLSFNASSFSGNPELCGLPLPNKCPGDLDPQITQTTQETDELEDKDKLITHGFFISLLIGLAFGFWGFFGILFVNCPQRYAYYRFLSHARDHIYVLIAVNYGRLQRRYF